MKVGILEEKDSGFIVDLMQSLKDLKPDFIQLRDLAVTDGTDYRVIVDRLGFQDRYTREYLKLASLSGCYVINNPFSSELNNKLVEIKMCSKLGLPFPKTIMLPSINEEKSQDHVFKPDWDRIKEEVKFPAIIKPHDGSGWDHVYEVNSMKEVWNIYDAVGEKYILLLQEKVEYVDYYRAYCVGKKDVLFVKYKPAPKGLGEYIHDKLEGIKDQKDKLEKWTIMLNDRIDFDFNSIEWCIDKDGNPFIIDAFNEVPDINKRLFPKEEYKWIIEHLAGLVREKFNNSEENKITF